MSIILTPAFGRNPHTKAEAIADFNAGKDWRINTVTHPYRGMLCSIRNFPGKSVWLRYNGRRDTCLITVTLGAEMSRTPNIVPISKQIADTQKKEGFAVIPSGHSYGRSQFHIACSSYSCGTCDGVGCEESECKPIYVKLQDHDY